MDNRINNMTKRLKLALKRSGSVQTRWPSWDPSNKLKASLAMAGLLGI